jgi:hypothetical protein
MMQICFSGYLVLYAFSENALKVFIIVGDCAKNLLAHMEIKGIL